MLTAPNRNRRNLERIVEQVVFDGFPD